MEQPKNYLYPRQKICGIWLVIVGLSMFTLLNNGYTHPVIFGILYILGMVFQLNPITRKKLAVGTATPQQKKWSNFSLLVLSLCCFIGVLISNGNTTQLWLSILLAVGIHFFFFIPVHGKLLGILGAIVTLNVLLAIFIKNYSLNTLFVVDGWIKFLFGLLMIRLSPINF